MDRRYVSCKETWRAEDGQEVFEEKTRTGYAVFKTPDEVLARIGKARAKFGWEGSDARTWTLVACSVKETTLNDVVQDMYANAAKMQEGIE